MVYSLQYSCLKDPMDKEAWQATVPWGCKESDMTKLSRGGSEVSVLPRVYPVKIGC